MAKRQQRGLANQEVFSDEGTCVKGKKDNAKTLLLMASNDDYIKHGVAVLIIICGLIPNGFICIAFLLCRRLRTITNYFVVNLALAGILSCLNLVVWEFSSFFRGNLFVFAQSFEIFAGCASIASVTVIAFDRYFAVSRPLHYNTYVTHKKALIGIAGIWSYATILALMSWFRLLEVNQVFMPIYAVVLATYNFLVAMVLCLFCYISILLIAWPHIRQNAAQNYAPNSRGFALAKQLKISFTILLLSAPIILCWSVFFSITVMEIMFPDSIRLDNISNSIVSFLPNVTAAFNAIIYICLTRDLRGVAISVCCSCRKERRERRRAFPLSDTSTTNTRHRSSPVTRL